MSLTKAKAEALNKSQLVDKVLELQARIDASEGKPLTSAEIEKRLLDLTELGATVKLKADTAKMEFEAKVAEINASKEKDLKRLELEFNSGLGQDAIDLKSVYEDLEIKAKKAIDDLSYGLKKAEIEAKNELDLIQEKVEKAESEAAEKISGYESAVEDVKTKSTDSIAKMKSSHERDVEQLNYDNKLAIRDVNEKVASEIAKKLSKELIDSKELESLKAYKSESEESVNSRIEEAINLARREVHAIEGAKYNSLKSSTDNALALAENDKTHLKAAKEALEKRVEDLEERLKDVPAQIAKAVGEAKSNTVVNQTGGGK